MQRNVPLFRGAALALVFAAGLSACDKGAAGQQQVATAPRVGVVAIAPQRVALDTELPGRTAAHTLAEVRPQVGGIVLKRLFTEGADVKAGQPLYQIDPATYRASAQSAEANLAALKLKVDRYKQLIAINAVGQQDYDDAVSALKQAQAAADTARINLGYTRVLAPVSGRIGKSTVTEGALVTADQATALTTIQALDPIYVDVTRSSGELLQLKQQLASGTLKSAGADAARVRLVLEDGSAYPLEGKLQFTDVTVDPSTGAVTLRAEFPNPKHALLPGMFVRAKLIEGVNEQAILVQQDAISHNEKGEAVAMVVGAGNKVEARVVQTPRAVGNRWLVSQGLKPGDRVIVEGLQYVRPGMPVQATPAQGGGAGE
ncbi:efflux RND transporter periplasmic adaptor subunit [Paludibacterium purpuratum]|uniref:Membrane fusion protein (Multidrug efflux system) n=1 Tax=Paludibacterium purpuratum TaxID=1144873 RepID=A0A4R7BD25_9NEIS|nr:efflux RND transporter periplasmic adaptor subunit [Paludibacterium purpuratum]TDR82964.1 membrane fusion protein (multidrug efflux system) [Paludibacterium purpuratum]